MRRSDIAAIAPATPRRHSPWLLAAVTTVLWFEVLRRAARALGHLPLSPELAVGIGLATQLAFTAFEALLGVAAWAVLGTRVRWLALMPLLLAASSMEAVAVAVASGNFSLPAPWPVLLAGARAEPGDVGSSAGAQAFAAFGALTLARLALAAHAHGVAARVSWRRAALVVLGFYLATRCAMWWSLDLMRGHSFETLGGR